MSNSYNSQQTPRVHKHIYTRPQTQTFTTFTLNLSLTLHNNHYSQDTFFTMVRFSNNVIGLLNFLTFLLSIPILVGGVWLSKQGTTECERWLEKPVIALGVFLMIVSLAGLIGACCRVSWLLWLYLLVMFLLIVLLFAFTIFAFVVTNKGAGETVSGRGYKEYRLGDYSNWLQKRVNNANTWNRIKSCLQSGKVCTEFQTKFLNDTVNEFYSENLSAIQVSFSSSEFFFCFPWSLFWVVAKISACSCKIWFSIKILFFSWTAS